MNRRLISLSALDQEIQIVARREKKLLKMAISGQSHGFTKKIPSKVRCGLEAAFSKAFSMVFGSRGRSLIEKCCSKDNRHKDHQIRDYAIELKGGRKEFRRMRRNAQKNGLRNMVLTATEGIGLGVLGIGLPDIVLFLCILLKGIFETAIDYGYDYKSPSGQVLILKMIEAALSHGERRNVLEHEVDSLLDDLEVQSEELQIQMRNTAKAFASDMLLLKFIQGLPIVGIVGGMGNPLYYHRILQYVQLKYWKGYLLRCKGRKVSGTKGA